jgi:hypothetical protein
MGFSNKYLKIVKVNNQPLSIMGAEGENVSFNIISFEVGIDMPTIFKIDGHERKEEVYVELNYANFIIKGFLDENLIIEAKAANRRVENGLCTKTDEALFHLKLVQYVKFESSMDGKPRIILEANLWDDDDYNQAMNQTMNQDM